MSKKAWEVFEAFVNERLGLDSTVASGATWKDKGDGTTRNNYTEEWPLLVDAKTTERESFSLKSKFLEDMLKVARQGGKTFALPLRFVSDERRTDWVVVPLEDYVDLVEGRRAEPPTFDFEDVAFVRALGGKLQSPYLVETLRKVLRKMGDEE